MLKVWAGFFLIVGLSTPALLVAAPDAPPISPATVGSEADQSLFPPVPPLSFWQQSEIFFHFGFRRSLNTQLAELATGDAFLADLDLTVHYRWYPFEDLGFYFGPSVKAHVLPSSSISSLILQVGGGVAVGWQFTIFDWLLLKPYVAIHWLGIGLWFQELQRFSEFRAHPMAEIALPVQFQFGWRHALSINPVFGILDSASGGLGVISIGIGLAYVLRLGAEPPPPPKPRDNSLRIEAEDLEPLFPSLLPSERGVPLRLKLSNVGPDPLDQLQVKVSLRGYMDRPLEIRFRNALQPGDSRIEIVSLQPNRAYREIEQDVTSAFLVDVDYSRQGFQFEYTETLPVKIYSRSSLTWADDRMFSVFVTSQDPVIEAFSRIAVNRADDTRYRMMPRKLELAMKLFTVLEGLSFSYVTDPAAPFMNSFGGSAAIDTVSYPRDMLDRRAGDCDDLTALYASLLESLGIRTAFVTIPGHIFMMFDVGVVESEWRDVTVLRDWVHLMDGSVWVPVEVTAIGQGFMRAWEVGAENVESTRSHLIRIYPTDLSWETFSPNVPPGSDSAPEPPQPNVLERLLTNTTSAYIRRELAVRVSPLLEVFEGDPNNVETMTEIAMLYSQFEDLDQSDHYLDMITLLDSDHVPALLLQASNAIARGQNDRASQFLAEVQGLAPSHPVLAVLQSSLGEPSS